MPQSNAGFLDQLGSEAAILVAMTAAFLLLLAVHLVDGARRRRRVADLRQSGEFGPRADRVRALIARAAALTNDDADRLADARGRALKQDPRAERPPAAARRARDRAFANERDVVALAAAVAAREAARAALGVRPPGRRGWPRSNGSARGADDEARLAGAAEAAAEAAAALVARDRIPDEEYRMLTRAWRTTIGPFAPGSATEGAAPSAAKR